MADEHITCGDCGQDFVFSDTERAFYLQRDLAVPPKRCKPCRDARKQSRGGGAPAGGSRGGQRSFGDRPQGGGRFGGERGGPSRDFGGRGGQDRGAPSPSRRFSGDVNEYRSPMPSADPWGPPAQRPARGPVDGNGYGDRGGAPNARGAAPQEQRQNRPWNNDGPRHDAPRQDGGRPAERGGDRGDRGGAPRAYGRQAPNGTGANEYRSPAFPSERGAERARPTWSDERPARRPARAEKPRAPKVAGEGDAQPKPRKPRPTFEITCGACGEKSTVPFQPDDGRDVFCQPCYQARRELSPEERKPGARVRDAAEQQAAFAKELENGAHPHTHDADGNVGHVHDDGFDGAEDTSLD